MAKKNEHHQFVAAMKDLNSAISEALKEITEEIYEDVDRGLDKAAEFTKQKLADASPGEETIKKAWEAEFKYTNVRYIYNTATRPKKPGDKVTSGEGNIPIVNLLEYSSGPRGKPFVRRTIDENEEEIVNIIKKEIKNGK